MVEFLTNATDSKAHQQIIQSPDDQSNSSGRRQV
jgi:hypothetical protein